MSVRVLLVDDHPVVLDGLKSSLRDYADLEIVGAAKNGEEAIALTSKFKPEVVLMDINMPRMNGIEATRVISKEYPETKILVLTMHDQPEYAREVIAAGARGYILKDSSPEDVVRAIRAVVGGGLFFASGMVGRVLESPEKAEKSPLSKREIEVLIMVAEGLSNKEVAQKLEVSVRTVETHREHIMKKLDLHNAAGLTRYAIARGMIKPSK